jgi:hypothetical protein
MPASFDHLTIVVSADPHQGGLRQEVQLLRYLHPDVTLDAGSGNLGRTGFNSVCFRVGDLDAAVEAFVAAGFATRNQPMVFHDRKLVFLVGLGDVVVELAEWL